MSRALKRVEGINVVPLIDVVLVLLAIVLTLSTFVASGQIKLDLPQASSVTKAPLKSVEISIDNKGLIYLDGTLVSKDTLVAKLSTITPEDAVSVRGDTQSMFGDFVFIMDSVKKQGVTKISIITQPNKG
jgi:biopolymer transport protein ExbD